MFFLQKYCRKFSLSTLGTVYPQCQLLQYFPISSSSKTWLLPSWTSHGLFSHTPEFSCFLEWQNSHGGLRRADLGQIRQRGEDGKGGLSHCPWSSFLLFSFLSHQGSDLALEPRLCFPEKNTPGNPELTGSARAGFLCTLCPIQLCVHILQAKK